MSLSRFVVHTLITFSLVHQHKLSKLNGNSIDPMDCYFIMLGTGICLDSFNIESKEYWQFCLQCKDFIFFFHLWNRNLHCIFSLLRLVDYHSISCVLILTSFISSFKRIKELFIYLFFRYLCSWESNTKVHSCFPH